MGIRKMFGGMMDLVSQMVLRWDRLGPNNEILCSDDFTRYASTAKVPHVRFAI
jgi:cytochrome P450 / NADPH-cytochrome P450 reductase